MALMLSMRSSRSWLRSWSVCSSSLRASRSSGEFAEDAEERMRRYEAKRGRVVFRAERTSLRRVSKSSQSPEAGGSRLDLQERVLIIRCGHHVGSEEKDDWNERESPGINWRRKQRWVKQCRVRSLVASKDVRHAAMRTPEVLADTHWPPMHLLQKLQLTTHLISSPVNITSLRARDKSSDTYASSGQRKYHGTGHAPPFV